jgi:tetratricopeptide (TPR) repeat protein
MTPEQFESVEALFEAAVVLPAAEREAYLVRECDDEAVRRKVLGMLAHERTEYLKTPAMGVGLGAGDPAVVEARMLEEIGALGRFRVLSKIGEGGFGAVYRAEQLSPVKRVVALKVIKLGMDTRRVVARFEAERQTVAMMDHPGIAKVYEAGATPSGRPYFAMEFVEGVPITQYCDQRGLTVAQRLELLVAVCHAVRHAHQKGVIHRDLKPTNVLVAEHDGAPAPKVIDFGISRAMDDSGRPPGEATEQGQMVGTPAYMSPEQAAGNADIDTRADIYSLGVVLFEMLTGTTPLDGQSPASPQEALKSVRESEPGRPSRRLKDLGAEGVDVARRRGSSAAALVRVVSGDLDAVCGAALENDRSRRYQTVDALAQDLQRWMRDEPVTARAPTAGYRLRKFAKRRKAAIGVGALALAALVGTSIGLVRSRVAESRARTEAATAAEVITFLNDDLLASASPEELGADVRVLDVVNGAAARVEGRFQDPAVEAAVRYTIGRTYSRLAEFEKARTHLGRALTLREGLFGAQDPRTLVVVHELGRLGIVEDRVEESEALERRAFEGLGRALGPDHPDTLESEYWLGVALGEQGRLKENESLMVDALERARRVLGNRDRRTIAMIRGVGVLYKAQGRREKAVPYLKEACDLSREVIGVNNGVTLLAMQDYAGAEKLAGRQAHAKELLEEALAASKVVRGERHPATIMTLASLANTNAALGDAREAEKQYRSALADAWATLPAGHTVPLRVQVAFADFLDQQGRHEEAGKEFVAAATAAREHLPQGNPVRADLVRALLAHCAEVNDEKTPKDWEGEGKD